MRYFRFLLIIALAISFSACKDNRISFGTVEYYPKFLWEEANLSPVTKTFVFDFSQDAKNDRGCYADFQFVDNDGNPISTSIMQVTIDGKAQDDNTFRVNSSESEKELTFTFSPEAKQKKYQGYLRLVSSNDLDRLDAQTLPGTTGPVDAFQWSVNYDKGMNPVAKAIMWIGIGIVGACVLWFFVLQRIIYPRFGSIQKTFFTPGAPIIAKFKGYRMVVIANSHPKKQSRWDRLFRGKIKYISHPVFTSPIILKPGKKRQILAKAQNAVYQIQPNPMPGIGSATITIINGTMKINVV